MIVTRASAPGSGTSCRTGRSSTGCTKSRSSSRAEGSTATRSAPTVPWATAHQHPKPSSRWKPGRSCTNTQTGPVRSGSPLGEGDPQSMSSRAFQPWRRKQELDQRWCARPGKPTNNNFLEVFNSRLGQECLNASRFLSMDDARTRINRWRTDYTDVRLCSELGNLTLSDYAAQQNHT